MKILSLTSTFKTFFLHPNRRTSMLHVQNILKVLKIWLFLLFSSFGASIFALKKHNEQYSLKLSFSRKLSRIAGSFATITIPKFLRKPLFTLYARIYHVNLQEMEKSVESFESFNKFFTRTIRPRPIHADPLSIASPADSRVLTYSEVKGDEVLIVKGIEYRLGEFLTGIGSYQIKEEVLESMKRDPKNKLYHIILYLAPGDYHRYHAPTNCTFKTRNHIIGKLHPVKEKYVKTHTGVYEKNERVSLFGDWVKGLMCMVLVGALNVGSIDLNFDKSLKTNTSLKVPFTNTQVKVYGEEDCLNESDRTSVNKGVQVVKGEEVGKFNLGSTVVLVFEASANFEWKVKPGEKVQYGQCIGVST